ncbi:MAG TPA: DnaJ domain-containing protein [Bacteroidales bacterium]|nr:DnaJ domain-containing protein [Bacteroidales bacterium]
MAGFTKWITGGLGFVLGGPIGALIGFAIGSLFDKSNEISNYQEQWQRGKSPYGNTAEGDFKMSLLVLIACVMKADGRPQKQELNVVKRFLLANFGEEGALEALQILKNLLKQDINDVQVARQINQYMNYSGKMELIHLLFEIAFADGAENPYEVQVIQRIAWNLGVSTVDFNAIKAPYTRTKDVNWAYTTLGVEPTATDADIKKAYRQMAKKYHPDTVANLGDDVKKKATEKFRAVNEAYEELKKARGFN